MLLIMGLIFCNVVHWCEYMTIYIEDVRDGCGEKGLKKNWIDDERSSSSHDDGS